MENYARRHSVGLVFIQGDDHIDLGSASCIRMNDHFLLATAGHNFPQGMSDDCLRVVPFGATIDHRIPVVARNAKHQGGCDVAWLEIPPESAERYNLEFLATEQIHPFENPTEESLYLAQGLPAEFASISSKTISVASLGIHDHPPRARSSTV